jgi:homoserine kinase
MQRRRVVRVPASSANLGSGFDVFAAALGLHLQLEVLETGRFGVQTELPIARDRRNLVVRGFERLHPADGFTFRITSEIPLAGGLGASAAAYLAGLMAADHLFELDADLLALGTELEGHPDNLAASLHGGFVICADGTATRLDTPTGLEAVLVVPRTAVRTAQARAALPAEVPMADAVHNIAHASLLVLGLSTGDLSLIARGLEDRIHQPRRAHLYPRSMELVSRAADYGAVGASISGAGPTVLFWTHWEQTGHVLEALRAECGDDCDVRRVQFAPGGADVTAL